MCFFLTAPLVGLHSVIVGFPDHTQFSSTFCLSKLLNNSIKKQDKEEFGHFIAKKDIADISEINWPCVR